MWTQPGVSDKDIQATRQLCKSSSFAELHGLRSWKSLAGKRMGMAGVGAGRGEHVLLSKEPVDDADFGPYHCSAVRMSALG